MKNVKFDLKRFFLYLGFLFLAVNLVSCSDDDDAGDIQLRPTASFDLNEEYTLVGNTITLESITVGQRSWLVAVNAGSENTNNFISEPVLLQSGENTNVQLTFDEDAISDDGNGQQVVLKLYADNTTGGTSGEWDSSDQPIMTANNVLITKTITVFTDDDSTAVFADFDTNGDGSLDADEVPATYQNNFTEWDADADGSLSMEEFYNTSFANTDMDDDDGISEEEWNTGFAGMFGNWADDDFASFDADADGVLDSDEWNTVFGESNWFETYDADSNTFVTEDEWNTGLFGDWDLNDDDMIDEDEFNAYSPYVANW
ncbi:DUF7282 domain-containing protein [Salinimicrobium oceani]|uniref:EF-hand domain-containing protein n=1 Tax=Salinimicrobium oceani TaxID=2722702 RepID=A0ABX1CYX7_9FLAO|nr:EF-hand domain-containing protein [Salinimicrobium oceani]NJW53160.1 EF-hand domain-containing protein [Salinimicrobium oceani]